MKNLSLILNIVLLLAVAHLYYLNLSKKPASAEQSVIAPQSGAGVKIAYVNVDTLDAKYEWLKSQKDALEKRITNAQSSLGAKKEALLKDMAAFQEKAQGGNVARADLEKEYEQLMQRQERLGEEEQRLSKSLAEEQKKAMDDLMSNVEAKLKSLQSQIGYDYILSYSKGGGQVLFANDSLEITQQVLNLLNAKEEKK